MEWGQLTPSWSLFFFNSWRGSTWHCILYSVHNLAAYFISSWHQYEACVLKKIVLIPTRITPDRSSVYKQMEPSSMTDIERHVNTKNAISSHRIRMVYIGGTQIDRRWFRTIPARHKILQVEVKFRQMDGSYAIQIRQEIILPWHVRYALTEFWLHYSSNGNLPV